MNYVSLFSSAGVGCFGFNNIGFDCIATSELIERRMNIQKINKKCKSEEGYILGDITQDEIKDQLINAIDSFKQKEKVDDVDVIIFTPPCQGMSVANHYNRDGSIDRNSLVVESLEIVDKIKPKFFISENVRAFMNTKCIDHNKEKKIKQAFHDWLSKDYFYENQIINFKDYGANSSRTRSLTIGVRRDLLEKVHPSDLFPDKEEPKTLFEIIGDLPSLNEMDEIDPLDIYHHFKPYREDMRPWIHDISEGQSAFDNEDINKKPHKIVDGEIVLHTNKHGDKYTRQCWNKVAPCVHTYMANLASQNTVHPTDDRAFTIRELMLMMNIPDNFKWVEAGEEELNNLPLEEKQEFLKKNENNIRECIGEAVPPIIMQKIASNIKEVLINGKKLPKFGQTRLI